jgi:DNA modification methylase
MQEITAIQNKIIKCELIEWKNLKFLQDDDFKVSTEEEYAKVSASLLNKHFIAPFYVWQDEAGIIHCLDGKRRDTVLREIDKAGGITYKGQFHPCAIPTELPALFIHASSKEEAAGYVLAYSSTYGTITQDGLHNFLDKFSLDIKELAFEVNFPDFSMDRHFQKFDVFDTKNSASEDLTNEELDDMIDQSPFISVKKGDIFKLGTGTIICGDSTKAETFVALLGNHKAVMVYTDPPYNLPYDAFGGKGKVQHEDFAMAAGEMSEEAFMLFLRSYMENLVSFSTDGSIHYHWMDFRHVWHVCEAANDEKTYKTQKPKQICVWNKSVMANGAFYRAKHEMCLIFKNGEEKHKSHLQMQDRTRANIWEYRSANDFGNADRERVGNVSTGMGMLEAHPTPKPVDMACDAILDVTDAGDIVMDCFSGSGSTLIATLETDRVFYGIEYEEKYVQLIIMRYLKYCDKKGLAPIFEHLNGDLTLNHFINAGADATESGSES